MPSRLNKLGSRGRISNQNLIIYVHYFAIMCLPLGKCVVLHLKKKPRRSLSGFQKCFALSLVKIDPMVLEKKTKIWKKFMKTTKTSQQRRTMVKCSVELGSGELKTINTTKRCVQFKNHCNYYRKKIYFLSMYKSLSA